MMIEQQQRETNMILKELRIRRAESYMDENEALQGSIKFKGQYGSTEITLNERLSQRIVDLCAEELAESARELADNMRADALRIMATANPKAITERHD